MYICAYPLDVVTYEWDPQKALVNLKKHKIDFADAVGVFEDPLAITVPDDRHEEARFVTGHKGVVGNNSTT